MNSLSPMKRDETYKRISRELTDYLHTQILKRNISIKVPMKESWITDFERMIYFDKRPPDQILEIMNWILENPKEISVNFSPQRLRIRYDEYLDKSRNRHTVHCHKKVRTERFLSLLKIPVCVKIKIQLHHVQIYNSKDKSSCYVIYADEAFEKKLMTVVFDLGCRVDNANSFTASLSAARMR